MTSTPSTEPVRLRDALRDNGLATLAMVLVVAVAVAGWSASFISLHDFAMAHMGFRTSKPAWLVPSTFDGAALGLSLLSFRAAIYGRASVGSLVYVYGFTGLSSWINWVHIDDRAGGKFVASLLPIAAVLVFGKVLKEAREAYERRHGKQVFKVRPGLLVLRWLADRRGTRAAIRTQILDIPVEALIGLGAGNLARQARDARESAAESAAPNASQSEASEVSQAASLTVPGDSEFEQVIASLPPAPVSSANGRRRVAAASRGARRQASVTARVGVDTDSVERAYRDSVEAGAPLSSRRLAELTGVSQTTASRVIRTAAQG